MNKVKLKEEKHKFSSGDLDLAGKAVDGSKLSFTIFQSAV